MIKATVFSCCLLLSMSSFAALKREWGNQCQDSQSVVRAAKQGNEVILEKLISSKNFCIDSVNKKTGRTALVTAYESGNAQIENVIFLIEKGADLKALTSNGVPFSTQIILDNNDELFTAVVEKYGARFYSYRDTKTQSSMAMVAVQSDAYDIFNNLMQSSNTSSLNMKNQHGDTSLHIAARYDSVGILELLTTYDEYMYDIEINAKNNEGMTPLQVAISSGSLGAVELLASHYDVDLNVKDSYGRSLFLQAVSLGNSAAVKELTNYGVNLDEVDDNGRNAFHYSAKTCDIKMFKFLLSESASGLNKRDRKGNTPLHHIVKQSDESCSMLKKRELILSAIEHDGDLGIKNKDGNTPLYVAINNDNTMPVLELLASSQSEIDDAVTSLKTLKSLLRNVDVGSSIARYKDVKLLGDTCTFSYSLDRVKKGSLKVIKAIEEDRYVSLSDNYITRNNANSVALFEDNLIGGYEIAHKFFFGRGRAHDMEHFMRYASNCAAKW